MSNWPDSAWVAIWCITVFCWGLIICIRSQQIRLIISFLIAFSVFLVLGLNTVSFWVLFARGNEVRHIPAFLTMLIFFGWAGALCLAVDVGYELGQCLLKNKDKKMEAGNDRKIT